MSAAGTPSGDPYVVVSRERLRYEEQFRALKPVNGVVTGEQAKGFFLQSQLPPMVLGQIWGLADTDADGKMDINEFSIACKLINLKLRGYEIPKMLPPVLIASLQQHQQLSQAPPNIPPLPNPALINAPPRPEPPKIPQQLPIMQQQPIMQQPSMMPQQSVMQHQQPIMPTQPIVPQQPILPQPPIMQQPSMMPQQPLIPQQPMMPQQSVVQQQPIIPQQPLIAHQPMLPQQPIIPQQPLIAHQPMLPQQTVLPQQAVVPQQTMIPTGVVPPMMQPMTVQQPISAVPPISSAPVCMSPLSSGAPPSVSSASNTPRASVTSLERAPVESSPAVPEWAVSHQNKLKYTQIFNSTDRTRSGYLTGPQARNVMVQTKLPQSVLAQIWALSDMDSDGRLGCEEFVLAMHLCEQASLGTPPPTTLPIELIPPSFRRAPRTASRTASISSQGSGQPDVDLTLISSQNTFEDKRKENFEKGQAELERRRKTLLDQQRKEAEERERKEREEIEKREKARLEAERKRAEELEMQMREHQEKERQQEEERKRMADQREAARKEMERQRQLEWEKQRLQELQQQRHREQENVLKLKAKNQSLTIELGSLNDQVKGLSQKICDTRVGVSNVKSTIDGMRSTRDTSMQEMTQLKNKLKEQNARLLQLSQEKVKLEAKNKTNAQMNEQTKQAFESKEINIKNLTEKIADMEGEIDSKMTDIENNNSQLTDLKGQLANLVNTCEDLYAVYEQKRETIMQMRGTAKTSEFSSAWGNDSAWATEAQDQGTEWPVDNWGTTTTTAPAASTPTDTSTAPAGTVKYRALYEFSARNSDEISFQPGDTINVPLEQTGEPGWLAGEIFGRTGWFPESYVEPAEGVNVRGNGVQTEVTLATTIAPTAADDAETKRLEGIAEVPETIPEPESVSAVSAPPEPEPVELEEYYVATYPYQSIEQGDLTFSAGEMIIVIKKEGDWWTGKIDSRTGIFPSNYVQKAESNVNTASVVSTAASVLAAAEQLDANLQMDNEVSQINENKEPEKTDFVALASSAQSTKGNKKPEIASVIAPYQASSNEQLSLERGQLIMIRKKTDSGWWEGELQAKGRKRQVGWFPASYVKVLNSTGRASGRTTPVSVSRMQQEIVIDKVMALYPYTAANPDELSFLKDDIISVTAREEQAWWRGELNGVSGLFPSNYVTPLQQFDDGSNKRRRDCIRELLLTERAYISDMSIVYTVFEIPIIESRVIERKDVANIFVNWKDILECNKDFLNDLLAREESGSDIIGDVILKHLPKMTAYGPFCKKQLDSAALLQNLYETSAPFRDLLKECQSNPLTKGMPLSSYLIKPMQRITKYPLLIGKILESTPDNHPDYSNLKEALLSADSFLKRINENVRQKEDFERLEWLQSYIQNDLNIVFNGNTNKLGTRKLIHYGILTKVKSGKELLGFLMNDFLLFVQSNKPFPSQFNFQKNSNVVYKMYKQPMMIQDLKAVSASSTNVENGTDVNRVLRLTDQKFTVSLLVPSVNERNLWLKRIEAAKEMYERAVALTRPRPKTMDITLTSWLFLNIQGASEIFPKTNAPHRRRSLKSRSFVQNVYCQVSLGSHVQNTNVASSSFNGNLPQNGIPQPPMLVWDYSMQFPIREIKDEVLCIVVYEMCPFTPDEFLGRAEVKLRDLHREVRMRKVMGPITKKLILHQVESGEVVIKFDMQLFADY